MQITRTVTKCTVEQIFLDTKFVISLEIENGLVFFFLIILKPIEGKKI